MIKNYSIEYQDQFKEELRYIIMYIETKFNNKIAANRLVDEIDNSIIGRIYFPESYEPYNNGKVLKHRYYRIYVKNYILFYYIENYIIRINSIIYKRRNLNNLVREENLDESYRN